MGGVAGRVLQKKGPLLVLKMPSFRKILLRIHFITKFLHVPI